MNDKNMKAVVNSFLLLLCLLAVPVWGQCKIRNMDEKLDTLTAGQCFSFHTNMIDWLVGTANATIEVDLAREPYHRWALLGNLKYNWNTRHTINPRNIYNLFELCIEGRYYWHTRSEGFIWRPDSNVSSIKNAFHRARTRVAVKKNPRSYRAYYLGLYGEYDDHTFLCGNGIQGFGLGVGIAGGFTQPLHQLRHGCLELEVGGRAGLRYTQFEKIHHESVGDAWFTSDGVKKKCVVPFPVIQDIHVSLVYRLVSSKDKYKWNRNRADQWDYDWAVSIKENADRADSRKLLREEKEARRKSLADSLKSVKEAKFVAKQMKKEAKRMRKDSIEAVKNSLKKMKKNGLSMAEIPIDTVARIEEVPFPDSQELSLPKENMMVLGDTSERRNF